MIFGFLSRLLLLAMVFVTAVAILPAGVNAQNDKGDPGKVEREDDDNDEDEKISAEDKQRVKLSLDDARTIAVGRVNGRVIDEELEKERGRLQYAFDIRDKQGKVWDVEIDAISGEVLRATEDDDDDDDDDDVRTTKSKRAAKKKQVERTAKVVKVKPN